MKSCFTPGPAVKVELIYSWDQKVSCLQFQHRLFTTLNGFRAAAQVKSRAGKWGLKVVGQDWMRLRRVGQKVASGEVDVPQGSSRSLKNPQGLMLLLLQVAGGRQRKPGSPASQSAAGGGASALLLRKCSAMIRTNNCSSTTALQTC